MRITKITKIIIFKIIIQCTDKLSNAQSINAPLQQGKRKKFPLLAHLKKCQRSFLRNWVKALSKSASYVQQQLSEMPSPPWLRWCKNECNTRQTSYVYLSELPSLLLAQMVKNWCNTRLPMNSICISIAICLFSSPRWWKSNVTWDRHQRPEGNEADPIRQEKAGRKACA